MEILKIDKITKSFSGKLILDNISFTVAKGELKVLIGPSGSGKSTLLQCLNYLIHPDSGNIFLEGKKVKTDKVSLTKLRQQMGMIFQDFNLFDHLHAMDNVSIALRKVKSLSKKEAYKRAELELTRVGLEDKLFLYPAELSGGQKQRVSIARALSMDPKIMLLDEPTSALDPEVTGEVIKVIQELAQSGMTMIMVTHQMNFIHTLADEILFMENGVLLEAGKPSTLFAPGRFSRAHEFCTHLNEFNG